jgi:hypothetical protein
MDRFFDETWSNDPRFGFRLGHGAGSLHMRMKTTDLLARGL